MLNLADQATINNDINTNITSVTQQAKEEMIQKLQ